MLEIIEWASLDAAGRKKALARAPGGNGDVSAVARGIVERVKSEGDSALRDYAQRFDRYEGSLDAVGEDAIKRAVDALSPEMRTAMETAIDSITFFHEAEKPASIERQMRPGVRCGLVWRPVERIGAYIPAGSAPLFSSLFMISIPAKIAGCAERVVCTPPQRNGQIDPTILAAAGLCGVTRLYPVGGAQAIAAMAYGTETIPKVDKLYGPGNAYVTFAKQLVSEDPDGAAIDMPAGPSEVMVLATGEANAAWIAADLLAQAEHGPDSQAMALVTSRALAEAVQAETLRQLDLLPRREITAKALQHSRILIVENIDTGLDVANAYASEHLILMDGVSETVPQEWVDRVQHAGSVFCGAFSPETGGDYATGTNHVLPNYGYTRAYSGLSVYSFMKSMTVQQLTQKGLTDLGQTLITLAEAEGLQAHANAARIRMG